MEVDRNLLPNRQSPSQNPLVQLPVEEMEAVKAVKAVCGRCFRSGAPHLRLLLRPLLTTGVTHHNTNMLLRDFLTVPCKLCLFFSRKVSLQNDWRRI